MFLNDLPDSCLLAILDHVNFLEDLVRLSKVSHKWSHLVCLRLTRVQYLLIPCEQSNDNLNTFNTLYMSNQINLKKIQLNKFLPNLRVLDLFDLFETLNYQQLHQLLDDNPTIKGLIKGFCGSYDPLVPCHYGNIEMLSCISLESCYKEIFHLDKITQLRLITSVAFELKYCSEAFRNLIRLHAHVIPHKYNPTDAAFFPNLKILEFQSHSYTETYNRNRLMDWCPSLESAYFLLDTKHSQPDGKNFSIIEPTSHYNLRDLVLQYKKKRSENWSSLGKFLANFPALKHLAIRRNSEINDDNVKELITLLPEIRLMDFRGSRKVTQKSAKQLRKYCEKSDRSIIIYYDCDIDEPSDWPKLGKSADKICFGFDFMRNCFFKHFDQLPHLLDS